MKVYLAVPYSHEDPKVRELRFNVVNQVAARLIQLGVHVYSPISHTHPIALSGDLPKTWDFWEEYDRLFLEWADELYVVPLAGWEESKGVQAEMKIAKELGKPVTLLRLYMDEEGKVDTVTSYPEYVPTRRSDFQKIEEALLSEQATGV